MSAVEVRNTLAMNNIKLIKYWSKKYLNKTGTTSIQDGDDFFQEAFIAFLLSAGRYNASRAKTTTFFPKRLLGGMIDSRRKTFLLRRGTKDDWKIQPVPIELEELDKESEYELDGNSIDYKNIINMGLNHLPKKQKEVIKKFFLEDKSQKTISEEMGMSAPNVSLLKKAALNNIRHILEKEGISKENVL